MRLALQPLLAKKLSPSCLANITQDPGGVLRLKLHFWQFAAISGKLERNTLTLPGPLQTCNLVIQGVANFQAYIVSSPKKVRVCI